MLNQYFNSKANEHGAAEKFGFCFVFCSEYAADFNSGGGDYKGRAADNGYRKPNVHLKKRKGDTDCQSVNARCHRNHEHAHKRKRGILPFAVLSEGLLYHVRAYNGKQNKRNPVVNAGDILLECRAEKIAYKWHQRLKSAEPQSRRQHVPAVHLSYGKSFAYRNGECVH